MSVDLALGDSKTIIAYASHKGVLRNQLAYILATSLWETAYTMTPVREAYWLNEQWREDNLSYYPWYGRGYVQLTWEDNYARAQSELHLGTVLTDEPDSALRPLIASRVLVRGMLDGWFTGKKLDDYITLQQSDYVNARRIINGTDHASDIADIAYEYDNALLNKGYGVDDDMHPDTHPRRGKLRQLVVGMVKSHDELVTRVSDLEERVLTLESANGSA